MNRGMPQALFKYESIRDKGSRSLLTDTVAGKTGGFTAGLGGLLAYDGRDAIYWARRGCQLRAKAAWYRWPAENVAGAWPGPARLLQRFHFDQQCPGMARSGPDPMAWDLL